MLAASKAPTWNVMSDLKPYRIRLAATLDYTTCRPLTSVALQDCLASACSADTQRPPALAILAEPALPHGIEFPPVGLLVAAFMHEAWHLLSIYVDEGWRRKGVATDLITTFADHPHVRGLPIQTKWSDRMLTADAFEGLLASDGWSPPEPFLLRVQSPVRHAPVIFSARDSYVSRLRRNGLMISAWTDLEPSLHSQALKTAARLRDDGILPDWADIAAYGELLGSPYSLCLHAEDGTLAGFILCHHQHTADRFVFPVGWVRPELSRRGAMLAMLSDVTARMHDRDGAESVAAFEASSGLPAMWALLERHFVPNGGLPGVVIDRMRSSLRQAGAGPAGD